MGNLWFGLAGIVWSLTVTEVIVFALGVGIWLASRPAINRGLAEGSLERVEQTLEPLEA